MGIVCFFRNYWRGGLGIWGTVLDSILASMEALYRICVKWRVFAYKHQWLHTVKLDVPVISVGNLAIGGTGKTPFSRWVYEKTLQMEFVPGVISGDMARDECELYKSWNPGGIFIKDRSKTKGAIVAVSRGAGLIIIDDGFQHLGLKRDLNIEHNPLMQKTTFYLSCSLKLLINTRAEQLPHSRPPNEYQRGYMRI